MKNLFWLLIMIISMNFSVVISQEKIIEEKEFKDLINITEQSLEGKIYRLTKTKQSFVDRNFEPEIVELNLKETIPPNKWRTVEEYKSAAKNTKTERLWDGQNLYEKRNNGEWVKYSGYGGGSGGGYEGGEITKTYKFIGKSSLNNQPINVYEMEINRIANKFTQTSMYQVHYVEKTRFWISEDSSIMKKFIESEIVGSKQLIRETWVYEYDSTIKIEPPIK